MSRGPGKIQTAIKSLMRGRPDYAWTTEDLVEIVYAGANRVEKKHRVSILRALRAVTKGDPDWFLWRSECRGGSIVLMNYASVRSYGLARLKVDSTYQYRGKDPRTPKHWVSSEADLITRLEAEPHSDYCAAACVAPGGPWWRHVQQHVAEREGDAARAATLKAESAAAMAKLQAPLMG